MVGIPAGSWPRDGRVRERFSGPVAGVGSTSVVRVAVGRWGDSPQGPFADVMVEYAARHRVLQAPTSECVIS